VFGALPSLASAAVPKGDVAILKYALTLEYLEAAFYKEAVDAGKLKGHTVAFAKKVAPTRPPTSPGSSGPWAPAPRRRPGSTSRA
jgi:hypothetical protein